MINMHKQNFKMEEVLNSDVAALEASDCYAKKQIIIAIMMLKEVRPS